jgi:hypothetical protein
MAAAVFRQTPPEAPRRGLSQPHPAGAVAPQPRLDVWLVEKRGSDFVFDFNCGEGGVGSVGEVAAKRPRAHKKVQNLEGPTASFSKKFRPLGFKNSQSWLPHGATLIFLPRAPGFSASTFSSLNPPRDEFAYTANMADQEVYDGAVGIDLGEFPAAATTPPPPKPQHQLQQTWAPALTDDVLNRNNVFLRGGLRGQPMHHFTEVCDFDPFCRQHVC